jgi:ABC transport system ATP-binding/permease protein
MAGELIYSIIDGYVAYAEKVLLNNVSLNIAAGDKICVVGKNGSGKSTLMNILFGTRELDLGKVWQQPSTVVGYLRQDVKNVGEDISLREFMFNAMKEEDKKEENLYQIQMLLSPFGLDENQRLSTLSGGEYRKAGLARALLSKPDILLLDEPTNHLDIGTIKWLENYLKKYLGAVLIISHDRRFLANISGKCFWLDRGNLRISDRGYAFFEEFMEQVLEQERKELINLQKKLENEEDWLLGVNATFVVWRI